MHDYLFLNQELWAPAANPEQEWDNYARDLDLDIELLHSDMNNDEVMQKVRNDHSNREHDAKIIDASVCRRLEDIRQYYPIKWLI